MSQLCVNASDQYFTFPALNISAPPVTLSVWIKVASIIPNKHTTLLAWRGGINTEFFLHSSGSNWQLRYSIAGGTQWNVSTGLNASTGVWQHACVAITSSQARLYLDGASFTNNASHSTANVNGTGYLGKDPVADGQHVAFDGCLAEPAIWTAALSDTECRALGKRLSPLLLKNRLQNLVMYRDLMRDVTRGIGPALTPINAPTVAAHPPMIYPQSRLRAMLSPTSFFPPFHLESAAAHTSHVLTGCAEMFGAAQGAVLPLGEVSS